MDIGRANKLAEKLDNISKHFDVVESTVIEVSNGVRNIIIDDEDEDSNQPINLINFRILKADFDMIRNTLIETINNGRSTILSICNKIELDESSSGDLIAAYAQLIGVVNNSLKLLTSTYKDILTIQTTVNDSEEKRRKAAEQPQGDIIAGTINNNNYIMAGSITDVIKQLQNKDK